MLERVLTGALGAVTPALLVVALVGAAAGPRFDLLHGGGSWAFLTVWAGGSVVLAAVPDAVRRWRLSFAAAAAVLLAAAVLVLARGAALGTATALGLAACAAICVGLVAVVSRSRVDRHKACGARRRPAGAAAATVTDDAARQPAGSIGRGPGGAAWLVCASVGIATFAIAWAADAGAERAAGGLALLAAVLLLVPATAARGWYPRGSAAVALLAAVLVAWLAWRARSAELGACAAAALALAATTVRARLASLRRATGRRDPLAARLSAQRVARTLRDGAEDAP